jgi:hypothetical protein
MTPPAAGNGTPALEALQAGGCTPSCLLSAKPGRCGCRCEGAWHGILLADLARPAETTTPAARKLSRAARRRRKRTEPRTAA